MDNRLRSGLFMTTIVWLCHLAAAQDCFNTEVQNAEWFAGYTQSSIRAPNNLQVKIYQSDSMSIFGYSNNGPTGVAVSTSDCVSTTHEIEPLMYSLVNTAGQQQCIEIFKTDEFTLAHTVDSPPNIVSSVSDCPTQMSDDNNEGTGSSAINVKYPFSDYDQIGDCGQIFAREYHAHVFDANGDECNPVTSKVTVPGTSLKMETCGIGNSYEKPFTQTSLKCVGTASPVALGAGQDQGTMLVLAYPDRNYPDTYSFLCAFFKEYTSHPDGVPRYEMSIDVTDIQEPKCRYVGNNDVLKGYERVGTNLTGNGANYIKLILKPNDCDKNVCLNDGNCTQYLEDYTCACPVGFTGKNCQTNIDDCVSRPCMNGGTCIDGVNMYTCVCPKTYSGIHCEDPICLLPEELAGSWYAGVLKPATVTDKGYQLEITEDQDTMDYWMDVVNERYSYSTECNPGSFGDTWNMLAMIYKKYDSAGSPTSPDKFMCMKFYLPGYIASQALLFYKKAVPGGFSPANPPNPRPEVQCETEPFSPDVYAMWRVGGSTSITCPFTLGSYFLKYQEGTNAEQCGASDTSRATISSDQLIFNSCGTEADVTQATFAQTNTESTWKCVADYDSATVFGTSVGDGRVLVVRNTANNLLACLRYRESGRTIEMSMLYTDETENEDDGIPYQAKCIGNMNYNTKALANYVYINMESDKCREEDPANPLEGPCLNGGTCTSGMQSWSCACPPGYTGNICQTEIQECASFPCENGGICNDFVNWYNCTCSPGYSGTHCELYDECTTFPCQNGGTCIEGGFSVANDYRCQCVPGYTGKFCETEINECLSMPCLKGGTCTDQLNGFTCTCPPGTTGTFCEIDINECESRPCQNGGTCKDRIDGYYCFCTDMYIGVHCEHFNECHSNPCRNGGTCEDDLYHYKCRCPGGLTGVNCETEFQTCAATGNLPCLNGATCVPQAIGYSCRCTSNEFWGVNCQWRNACLVNPCQNEGTCVSVDNGYVCSCTSDWTGPLCQNAYTRIQTTDTYQLDTITLIIIIIAVIVTICVICAIIFFACRHHLATKAAAYSNELSHPGTMSKRGGPHSQAWNVTYRSNLH